MARLWDHGAGGQQAAEMKYEIPLLESGDYEQMFTKSKKSSSAVVTELLRKPKMIGTVELEKEKKVQIFK